MRFFRGPRESRSALNNGHKSHFNYEPAVAGCLLADGNHAGRLEQFNLFANQIQFPVLARRLLWGGSTDCLTAINKQINVDENIECKWLDERVRWTEILHESSAKKREIYSGGRWSSLEDCCAPSSFWLRCTSLSDNYLGLCENSRGRIIAFSTRASACQQMIKRPRKRFLNGWNMNSKSPGLLRDSKCIFNSNSEKGRRSFQFASSQMENLQLSLIPH